MFSIVVILLPSRCLLKCLQQLNVFSFHVSLFQNEAKVLYYSIMYIRARSSCVPHKKVQRWLAACSNGSLRHLAIFH